VKHRKDLEAALEAAIARHERQTLLKMLEDAGVPATPVNTVDQVMNDPQTAARGIIQRVVHARLGEIPLVGTPLKFSRMQPGVRTPAPSQGQHTDEILAEHGYGPDAITTLRSKNVVR
jgi:crotonobetainyl-CoA:carnitine CoA-transferase CaiB-like acyl-CoA transferase